MNRSGHTFDVGLAIGAQTIRDGVEDVRIGRIVRVDVFEQLEDGLLQESIRLDEVRQTFEQASTDFRRRFRAAEQNTPHKFQCVEAELTCSPDR